MMLERGDLELEGVVEIVTRTLARVRCRTRTGARLDVFATVVDVGLENTLRYGDRVIVATSPNDQTRGRIVRRAK